MPKQNAIARHQSDALRLEVLRRYFDFSKGRPTAASIAEEMGLSRDTVETWLADPDNARMLDDIIPLWPNIAAAREFAAEHVDDILQRIADIALGKHPKARAADELRAGEFLLAVAGVRPADRDDDQPPSRIERQKPAVLVNMVFPPPGVEPTPVEVIDGEVREIQNP